MIMTHNLTVDIENMLIIKMLLKTSFLKCVQYSEFLHTVYLMYEFSHFVLKRIRFRVQYFSIWNFTLRHLTDFLNRTGTKNIFQAKIVIILSQLLSFNFNYCSRPQTSGKCANLFPLSRRDNIVSADHFKKMFLLKVI